MLALVVAVALSQCTKDTDCKGERVCVEGACVGEAPRAAPVQSDVPRREEREAMATEAMRLNRITQLERELAELRIELEDATMAGPFIKISGGVLLAGLVLVGIVTANNAYDCASRRLYGCGDGNAIMGGVVTAAILSTVLFIWGGVQLGNRIGTRSKLPGDIAARERELQGLRAVRP